MLQSHAEMELREMYSQTSTLHPRTSSSGPVTSPSFLSLVAESVIHVNPFYSQKFTTPHAKNFPFYIFDPRAFCQLASFFHSASRPFSFHMSHPESTHHQPLEASYVSPVAEVYHSRRKTAFTSNPNSPRLSMFPGAFRSDTKWSHQNSRQPYCFCYV